MNTKCKILTDPEVMQARIESQEDNSVCPEWDWNMTHLEIESFCIGCVNEIHNRQDHEYKV